jgi:hypothetical protein
MRADAIEWLDVNAGCYLNRAARTAQVLDVRGRAASRAVFIMVFFMRFAPAQYKLISCPSGSFK